MRYKVDHDFHIHSRLSYCSKSDEQTRENILQYAVDNGWSTIIITDHFWDELLPNKKNFYKGQDLAHVSSILPLPQHQNVRFLFGCETDMDTNNLIGIAPENYDKFDFIIVPTTHLHMFVDPATSIEDRAKIYVEKFRALLDSDLPFEKVGIAHLTCSLMANKWEEHLDVLDLVSDETFRELFTRSAELGLGIELNFPVFKYAPEELERALRPYRLAKECGCKFYFGSDAHIPSEFLNMKERFERTVDLLGLTEDDKFLLPQDK